MHSPDLGQVNRKSGHFPALSNLHTSPSSLWSGQSRTESHTSTQQSNNNNSYRNWAHSAHSAHLLPEDAGVVPPAPPGPVSADILRREAAGEDGGHQDEVHRGRHAQMCVSVSVTAYVCLSPVQMQANFLTIYMRSMCTVVIIHCNLNAILQKNVFLFFYCRGTSLARQLLRRDRKQTDQQRDQSELKKKNSTWLLLSESVLTL